MRPPSVLAVVLLSACGAPVDFSALDRDGDGWSRLVDCDDRDPDIHPGAEEIWYDGVDGNCDFADDLDEDGDGFLVAEDCDDRDPNTYPGAPDYPYDDIDRDCAGADSGDWDGDGQAATVSGGKDCNDADPTIYYGAPDEWYDGVDSDCRRNDDYDADHDGLRPPEWGGLDCDDTSPTVPTGWYSDVDGDGYGDVQVYYDCDIHPDASRLDGDCDDTAAQVNPAAVEICGTGVDEDCDGGVGNCTLSRWSSSLTSETDGVWVHSASTARLGFAVEGGQDLDGDGFADLAAGAYRDDTLAEDGGALVLWYGADGRSSLTPDLTLWGERASGRLGRQIAMGGDLDGDGLNDLAVAASYDSGRATNGGTVWLVVDRTGGSGAIRDASLGVRGDVHRGLAGEGLAVGDVDGDGQADLVVGAPGADSDKGAVHLLLGPFSADRQLSDSEAHGWGAQAGDGYGWRTELPGDLDGDGYGDLAVGAPAADDDGGLADTGAVYVFRGPLQYAPDPTQADLTVYGSVAGDGAGSAMVGLRGADGQRWLAVGAADGGKESLIEGGSAGVVRLAEGRSRTVDTGYGHSMTACDLDGDGADELVVGTPYEGPPSNTGHLYVYADTGAAYALQRELAGPNEAGSGYDLACLGSFAGQHSAALAVGEPYASAEAGAVRLLLGTGL